MSSTMIAGGIQPLRIRRPTVPTGLANQRFVHVHKLICTGTLEEKIDAMLEKKQFLNDQIIQSENWITELSTDELKDLVYLGS